MPNTPAHRKAAVRDARRPGKSVNWPGVVSEMARLREHSPAVFLYIVNCSQDRDVHHRVRVLIRDHPDIWRAYVADLQAKLPAFPHNYFDTAAGASYAQEQLDNVKRALNRDDLPPIPAIPVGAA